MVPSAASESKLRRPPDARHPSPLAAHSPPIGPSGQGWPTEISQSSLHRIRPAIYRLDGMRLTSDQLRQECQGVEAQTGLPQYQIWPRAEEDRLPPRTPQVPVRGNVYFAAREASALCASSFAICDLRFAPCTSLSLCGCSLACRELYLYLVSSIRPASSRDLPAGTLPHRPAPHVAPQFPAPTTQSPTTTTTTTHHVQSATHGPSRRSADVVTSPHAQSPTHEIKVSTVVSKPHRNPEWWSLPSGPSRATRRPWSCADSTPLRPPPPPPPPPPALQSTQSTQSSVHPVRGPPRSTLHAPPPSPVPIARLWLLPLASGCSTYFVHSAAAAWGASTAAQLAGLCPASRYSIGLVPSCGVELACVVASRACLLAFFSSLALISALT
ncbi:hypothetical protein G7Z17_g5341 [Cylindrodendrum hubeiense]|uniref:Uncharacterized protein n=1 Tax=Cylindrodendrum hubeiense TaxID=595255 RepID=A0A9P5HEB7_9HYPO|nr:hypothetical protein G7Z17_g5341 [Cylindrodendrum hubeiense]